MVEEASDHVVLKVHCGTSRIKIRLDGKHPTFESVWKAVKDSGKDFGWDNETLEGFLLEYKEGDEWFMFGRNSLAENQDVFREPVWEFRLKPRDDAGLPQAKRRRNAIGDEAAIDTTLCRLPPIPHTRSLLHRSEALNAITAYVCQVRDSKKGDGGKFEMLGCSGMKGIGKTSMLIKTVLTIPARQKNVKALYVTFNGGHGLANSFSMFFNRGKSLVDAFACSLMEQCKVEPARVGELNFCQSIVVLRSLTQCAVDDTLLICLDEIGELDRVQPTGSSKVDGGQLSLMSSEDELLSMRTASSLMSEADKLDGKLAFIFSHIQQRVLDECQSNSGRKVRQFLLPPLPLHSWKELLESEWVEAAANNPAIHHLILSCCGHPRSLVDGLRVAKDMQPTLLDRNPPDDFLTKARVAILDECKFRVDVGHFKADAVQSWFSPLTSLCNDELLVRGEALQLPNGVTVLQPMALQFWAQSKSGDHALANHLNKAYAADAGLGPSTEKNMESLFFHYEAVLRISLCGQLVALESFYNGGFCGSQLKGQFVRAILPPGCKDIVAFVTDFNTDKDTTLRLLRHGYIVVSSNTTEYGIEYLSPYVTSDGQLLVAAVQCKFVNKVVAWSDIFSKLKTATDALGFEDVIFFPVAYATPDLKFLQGSTFKDGVAFTESGIFTFTRKMGILRLHVMKLGAVLKQMYPWLAAAQTSESQSKG